MPNVDIIFDYCRLELKTTTDENGDFAIGPLSHFYYFKAITGYYPESPDHNLLIIHYRCIGMRLRSLENKINFNIIWAKTRYLPGGNSLYCIDYLNPQRESVFWQKNKDGLAELVNCEKYEIDYSNPPSTIEIKGDNFKLIFHKSFLKQLIKHTVTKKTEYMPGLITHLD